MTDISKYSNTPIKHMPEDYCPTNEMHFFEIQKGLDKGKRMFYRDSILLGNNPDKCIVFVHGNPECSYTYRNIIKQIVKKTESKCRIVSMDHIGFGLSDQATHEMVCIDHADNLLQLIRELDLQNVTLVVHDWGGPIGIGTFLNDPERVKNLVLLNTTVFPIPKTGMTFQNYPISWLGWCYTPQIIPDRFWGDFVAYAILTSPNKPIPLLSNMIKSIILMELEIYQEKHSEAQRVFKEQFKSKINVKSSKRLVMQTKYWGDGNIYFENSLGKRSTIHFYRNIQEKIFQSWGPKGLNIEVRAILGRWDPLAKNEVVKQWIKKLPQLKNNIKIYKNVGHFVEEVKYTDIANAILKLA